MLCVLLSQQEYQELQNSMHLYLKILMETIVSINIMVYIIFKLDKDVISYLMIVIRKFMI